MSNRRNAYKEVYTILQDLNEEEYNKIPSEVVDAIKENMNQEYEFYYENETINHGIIDLLLEYDNEYIIIDYKLKNIENEAYKNQLNGYKKYIQDMTGKTSKVYLYSFIDSNLVSIS